MNKLKLIFAFIWSTQFCFAQGDYRSGFVITNERDTINGFIDYREGLKAHHSCDFKRSLASDVVTYEPGSIVGYGFLNDRFYESREVPSETKSSEVFFAELLVKGLVSLYKYQNLYFVSKEDQPLKVLKNETKQAYVDGQKVFRNTNEHIGILNTLLFDCVETRAKVNRIKLKGDKLVSLIEEYNRCKGEAVVTIASNKPWTRIHIGAIAGLNISKLVYYDNIPEYEYMEGAFDLSKAPQLGISLDVLSPRISERFSLQLEFLYSMPRYQKSKTEPQNNLSISYLNHYVIEINQLSIPIGLRYTFRKREFTPFLNFGVAPVFHLNSYTKWDHVIRYSSGQDVTRRRVIPMKSSQVGLWGGLGVLKPINNKFDAFLEMRYGQTDGIAPWGMSGLNTRLTNVDVLLGIRLK